MWISTRTTVPPHTRTSFAEGNGKTATCHVQAWGQPSTVLRCSSAKGISASVQKTTLKRSDKKLEIIFVDLSGKKPVKSRGGKQYAIIFRDDKTRMMWEYYLRRKSDAL